MSSHFLGSSVQVGAAAEESTPGVRTTWCLEYADICWRSRLENQDHVKWHPGIGRPSCCLL
eukprot:5548974-Amphidinium_carterae.1